jgi:hypothetical protein
MTPYEIALQNAQSPLHFKYNFIRPKGWTWGYFRYRFMRPLLKVNYKVTKLFYPISPWTTVASIQTFGKILKPHMIGFEYGSGFSTLFFARQMKHMTSIEHNPEWYRLVSEKFKALGIANVDYHLIPIQEKKEELAKSFSFYNDYHLSPSDFQIRTEYTNYFKAILKYPDAHFDFIMVDGRARVECCLLAIPKLKSGGFFVLDNSDRTRYRPVFKVLKDWKSVTTTTGLFDTTIWFKP